MRFSRSYVAALGYELAPNVVTSDAIEEGLAPAYAALRIQRGQLYALTGIRERRWWDPGMTMADGAARAARKAIQRAGLDAAELGMVIYAGVCRDNLEPATACAVADALGVRGDAQVYDIANACLGQLNGMIHIAGAIEAGQIRAGIVCSCESSRQIMDLTIDRLLRSPDMQTFKLSLATLTGGSGAAAVLLVRDDLAAELHGSSEPHAGGAHRLLGGVCRTNPRWHKLCRWGPDTGIPASAPMVMQTDAPAVLEHGVELGVETMAAFRTEMNWNGATTVGAAPTPGLDLPFGASASDKVVCHQVGAGHRIAALAAMGIPVERDFSTFEYLGNIGTVSLPLTAALADERGFLESGNRVGFLGIGSGLNCLMLGLQW